MALQKTQIKSGMGNGTSRWVTRAEVKDSARKARRAASKKAIKE